jgi:threonine dehydratase
MQKSGQLRDELFNAILMARQRVYAIGDPTPLERIDLPVNGEVFLKREDLSPIHAYKWRGAYNRMALLTDAERARGVVCASAGNHAQGVALAARKLNVQARVFMPVSTPRMKQVAVRKHGGDHVEVVLEGDAYQQAYEAALACAEQEHLTFIHPYDDLAVMGGQGTIADEIVMSGEGPFDVAYLQIGGGGMAAAVACWLKAYYPRIEIVGVEGTNQASMAAAVEAGNPVTLDYVDVFCDGTAVQRVGDLTYRACKELIDRYITVTNEEVCAAIQTVWEAHRQVPEPSGAMGLAGLMKEADTLDGRKALCVLCGANLDFGQFTYIARHAGIGANRRHYLRIELKEKRGALLELLETTFEGVNIFEFQFGKVHPDRAYPVIGVEAPPAQFALMERTLADCGYEFEDVTSQTDVEFRMVHYESSLFMRPYFVVYEFPERAGALLDFLQMFRDIAGMCYFNYSYTGEQVGRALIGFEFETDDARDQFRQRLNASGQNYRVLEEDVLTRVL